MQYADMTSSASLAVLFAFYVAQWALVAAVLHFAFARFSPAKHLGPAAASPAGSGSSKAGDASRKPSASRMGPEPSGSPKAGGYSYSPLQAAEESAV